MSYIHKYMYIQLHIYIHMCLCCIYIHIYVYHELRCFHDICIYLYTYISPSIMYIQVCQFYSFISLTGSGDQKDNAMARQVSYIQVCPLKQVSTIRLLCALGHRSLQQPWSLGRCDELSRGLTWETETGPVSSAVSYEAAGEEIIISVTSLSQRLHRALCRALRRATDLQYGRCTHKKCSSSSSVLSWPSSFWYDPGVHPSFSYFAIVQHAQKKYDGPGLTNWTLGGKKREDGQCLQNNHWFSIHWPHRAQTIWHTARATTMTWKTITTWAEIWAKFVNIYVRRSSGPCPPLGRMVMVSPSPPPVVVVGLKGWTDS